MNRSAFTLVESVAVVAALAVGLAVTAVSIGTTQVGQAGQPGHGDKRKADDPKGENDPDTIAKKKAAKLLELQLKDATMIRGLHQGFVMFGQNNGDKYPLPSTLDKDDATVKANGAEKDTTANIYSVMIYNGFFGTELMVSSAESNDKIKVCDNYAYTDPKKAAKPALALWDPGFSADFTGGNTGNVSFAHAMPSKSRLDGWKNKFEATLPIVGNRGPKVTGVKVVGEDVEPELPEKSKTYAIHGDPAKWEGNICFGDNHTEYMTTMTKAKLVYKDAAEKEHPDVIFYNEPEDLKDANAVLGIFINAGPTTKSFKPIWD